MTAGASNLPSFELENGNSFSCSFSFYSLMDILSCTDFCTSKHFKNDTSYSDLKNQF